MKHKAVILFTKVPSAGKVKTRLRPFLSGEECAAMQEAFIKDIFSTIKTVFVDIIVCCTPENSLSLIKNIAGGAAAYMPQRGGGLGDKMHNAISDVLSLGYDRCVLIGSDIPLLSKEDVYAAFDILEHNDIAVSPTEDGGYYLIGMKEPCASVFHMEYGVGTVFENTCAVIQSLGKTYGTGPSLLDIDDKYDLSRLISLLEECDPERCIHTRKALRAMVGIGDMNECAKRGSDS